MKTDKDFFNKVLRLGFGVVVETPAGAEYSRVELTNYNAPKEVRVSTIKPDNDLPRLFWVRKRTRPKTAKERAEAYTIEAEYFKRCLFPDLGERLKERGRQKAKEYRKACRERGMVSKTKTIEEHKRWKNIYLVLYRAGYRGTWTQEEAEKLLEELKAKREQEKKERAEEAKKRRVLHNRKYREKKRAEQAPERERKRLERLKAKEEKEREKREKEKEKKANSPRTPKGLAGVVDEVRRKTANKKPRTRKQGRTVIQTKIDEQRRTEKAFRQAKEQERQTANVSGFVTLKIPRLKLTARIRAGAVEDFTRQYNITKEDYKIE